MSEWTKNPEIKGAYWFQIEGLDPDIVWVFRGRVWDVLSQTVSSVESDARLGMFYGPLDLPPPMPTLDQ